MVGGRLGPAGRWRSIAIGGVFSAPLSRLWGPASRPISIFQTVSEGDFSEVRCSKRPLAREALPAPRLLRTQTSENDEYPTWGM
jgi:hypothetical protein